MSWIQTAHRKKVDLRHPKPEDLCLADVAFALSRFCRYTGHSDLHYSVAEHCCHVSDALRDAGEPVDVQFAGHMHDAPESMLGDTSKPMKLAMGREWSRALDMAHDAMWKAMAERWSLQHLDIHHPRVKEFDMRILLDECDVLLGGPIEPWAVPGEPLGVQDRIKGWSSERARWEWLKRFLFFKGM